MQGADDVQQPQRPARSALADRTNIAAGNTSHTTQLKPGLASAKQTEAKRARPAAFRSNTRDLEVARSKPYGSLSLQSRILPPEADSARGVHDQPHTLPQAAGTSSFLQKAWHMQQDCNAMVRCCHASPNEALKLHRYCADCFLLWPQQPGVDTAAFYNAFDADNVSRALAFQSKSKGLNKWKSMREQWLWYEPMKVSKPTVAH